MAILRHPVLDTLSGGHSSHSSIIHSTEWYCRHSCSLDRLQDPSRGPWPLDLCHEYGLLWPRAGILPSPNSQYLVLGLVDAWRGFGDLWA